MTRLEQTDGPPTILLVSRDDSLCRDLSRRVGLIGAHVQNMPEIPGQQTLGLHYCVAVVDLRSISKTAQAPPPPSHAGQPRWLYLAAGGSAAERVAILRAGADDVMARPLDLDELTLRIVKLSERQRDRRPSRLVVGDLVLDEEAREVVLGVRRLRLSPTEFGVLRVLLRNCGVVVSKQQILGEVWGYGAEADDHIVELYISYLRKKLGSEDGALIHTVRGKGYLVRPAGQPGGGRPQPDTARCADPRHDVMARIDAPQPNYSRRSR